MPSLSKVALKLGEGHFIQHRGKVLKLGVQTCGPDVSMWIADIEEKSHVILPVIPSEIVEEGVDFDHVIWNLVALLLHRMTGSEVLGDDLKSLVNVLKVDLEKCLAQARGAMLEVEEVRRDLASGVMVLNAKCESLSGEIGVLKKDNEALKKENASLREWCEEMRSSLESVHLQLQQHVVGRILTTSSAVDIWLRDNSLTTNGKNWEDRCVVTAVESGRVDILRWLHSLFLIDSKRHYQGKTETICALAVRERRLGVIQWLHSVGMLESRVNDPRYHHDLTLSLFAAKAGFLELLEWMKSIRILELIDATEDEQPNNIAHMAATEGHLDILQWLYDFNGGLACMNALSEDNQWTLAHFAAAFSKEPLAVANRVSLLPVECSNPRHAIGVFEMAAFEGHARHTSEGPHRKDTNRCGAGWNSSLGVVILSGTEGSQTINARGLSHGNIRLSTAWPLFRELFIGFIHKIPVWSRIHRIHTQNPGLERLKEKVFTADWRCMTIGLQLSASHTIRAQPVIYVSIL